MIRERSEDLAVERNRHHIIVHIANIDDHEHEHDSRQRADDEPARHLRAAPYKREPRRQQHHKTDEARKHRPFALHQRRADQHHQRRNAALHAPGVAVRQRGECNGGGEKRGQRQIGIAGSIHVHAQQRQRHDEIGGDQRRSGHSETNAQRPDDHQRRREKEPHPRRRRQRFAPPAVDQRQKRGAERQKDGITRIRSAEIKRIALVKRQRIALGDDFRLEEPHADGVIVADGYVAMHGNDADEFGAHADDEQDRQRNDDEPGALPGPPGARRRLRIRRRSSPRDNPGDDDDSRGDHQQNNQAARM